MLEKLSGSIRDYVKKYGPMSGPDVVDCASQILSGLNHIHVRDIIHRDLHIDVSPCLCAFSALFLLFC